MVCAFRPFMSYVLVVVVVPDRDSHLGRQCARLPACLPAAAAGGGGLTVLYELARRVIDGRSARLACRPAGLFAHCHRFVLSFRALLVRVNG